MITSSDPQEMLVRTLAPNVAIILPHNPTLRTPCHHPLTPAPHPTHPPKIAGAILGGGRGGGRGRGRVLRGVRSVGVGTAMSLG